MELGVICWNVLFSPLEFFEYVPFVNGTSGENERVMILERVMEVVEENEFLPVVNLVN